MPLQLRRATPADIRVCHVIAQAAYADATFYRALWPHGQSEAAIDFVVEQDNKNLADPAYSYLVICDTDAGDEIIAAATWKLEDEKSYEADTNPVSSTSQRAPPGKNMAVSAAFRARALPLKLDAMKDKTYWHLTSLVTHPSHHRRGAGRMLIDWGTEEADAAGLESFVNGSMQGKALYMKCGFQTVGVTTLDLQPWGVDDKPESYAMVRPAKV